MLDVNVFSRDVLIGTSQLFAAVPPMGVAAGLLTPTAAYAPLRPKIDVILSSQNPDWAELALKVVAHDGSPVIGVGGIWIEDLIANEDLPPEITVAGIDCASGLYEAWFGRDPAYLAYYSE
jgi:hypothetical protein